MTGYVTPQKCKKIHPVYDVAREQKMRISISIWRPHPVCPTLHDGLDAADILVAIPVMVLFY